MSRRGIFVTGTDTDVGKTFVTAGIVAVLHNQDVDELAMYSMVYQMTSQTTSDWVKMAEKARAKRGEYTVSFAPYGYDKIGKSLVISQDESPIIVQRIFNLKRIDVHDSGKVTITYNFAV